MAIRLGANPQPLRFETRSVDALLIYLACQQRPISRDFLAELFWPERTQKQARANLRLALHRLRHLLAPYLVTTPQSMALAAAAPVQIDSLRFAAHLAADQLVEATELYQGDFLDGFYLDGSPAFEQWTLLERERLRTLAIGAYQQRIGQLTAQNAHGGAVAVAQQLLRLDPLHEPTHRQLMRLFAQAGQRTAALAQYERCCQLLQRELAVTPDESTTTLAEQIRAGDLRFLNYDLRKDGLSEQTRVDRKSEIVNLPLQATPFIGRELELTQIAHLFANPNCRLLSLLGVGGMGKTRLALEAARRQTDNFADGVCYVALAAVGSTEHVPLAIAQALDFQTTSNDLLAQITAYLQPRQLLLVLDNFEHLLESAALVVHLLQGAPHIKVLITARQRLDLREEWLLPVAGLAVTGAMTTTKATSDKADQTLGEAGELFLRSAQRVLPDFIATGQEALITAICRQVEGMPLALELAASWVRVMPCAEILRHIECDLDFLSSRSRNQPERHRSIRTLFDHSWRLLTPAEQTVLMRLSVFQGGWLLDEALTVADATPAILLGLVDKSLVRLNPQQRFTMHELVRQYASEQLAAKGETTLICQRHFAAYLALARHADGKLRGPEARGWFTRLDDEQANLNAALQWALTTQRFADAAWLGIALGHYWNNRGNWHERAKWLGQLLPHRQQFDPKLRLATLLTLYSFWRAYEDFAAIDYYWNELLTLQQSCPDRLLSAATWYWAAVAMPDADEAIAAWEKAIDLARAANAMPDPGAEFCSFADQPHLLAVLLFRYAIRLTDIGEYIQAERLSLESLTIFRTLGNRDLIAFALGNLGRLALLRGEIGAAYTHFHEAVSIAEIIGNQMTLSNWQPLLGITTLYCGDTAEAQRILSASVHRSRDMKNAFVLARSYTYLAEAAMWQGDLDNVTHWLTHAWRHHANPRWIKSDLVDCLWVTARLATAQQAYIRAATLFGLAEQVSQRIRYPLAEPVQSMVNAALATVQTALEPAVFAEAFATGQQMTLAEAFATILVAA
ncbi:MAG: BTAD domain-containing putative transcriptional regulator [Caldilineaceae bacterium]